MIKFSDLYIQRKFHAQGLAVQANVPIDVIDRMLLDQTVSREIAERVLTALSLRTGQNYSLDTVWVNIGQGEQQQEMADDDESK